MKTAKLFLYYLFLLCVGVPVIVVTTILAGALTIIGSLLGAGRFWGYWPAHIWARICLAATLVRVKVSGRDKINPGTSYVFVANHQGAYDIFTVYGYLNHDFRWMMKKELLNFPVIGAACKSAGHIFVDNSNPTAIRQTMAKAESTLKDGMSLVVFPEGSRTFTGKMKAFHKGAFQLALEFGLPVVPVTIDGAFEVMPRTRFIPHWGTIKMTVHEPVAPPVDEADRQRVITESFDAVQSALPARHKRPAKQPTA